MPTSNFSDSQSEYQSGLLDISIELSTQYIVAGSEFSVYVVTKNPYSLPVIIDDVSVNIPSEIEVSKGLGDREELDVLLVTTDMRFKQFTADKLIERSNYLQKQITESNEQNDPNAKIVFTQELEQIQGDLQRLLEEMQLTKNKAEHVSKSLRSVTLASSLPQGAALCPGDTAVHTIAFCTKSHLLFRPTRFGLHVNVVYHFGNSKDFRINTISTEISIGASTTAILVGSLVGGLFGFLARSFRNQSFLNRIALDWPTMILSLLLSLILSAISIVFIARKSQQQAFVSVEDFWGGVLIGFLIGYSGVAAFESVSGLAATG